MSRYLYVMIFRAQNHESFTQRIVKDFQKDVRGTVQTYYRDVWPGKYTHNANMVLNTKLGEVGSRLET